MGQEIVFFAKKYCVWLVKNLKRRHLSKQKAVSPPSADKAEVFPDIELSKHVRFLGFRAFEVTCNMDCKTLIPNGSIFTLYHRMRNVNFLKAIIFTFIMQKSIRARGSSEMPNIGFLYLEDPTLFRCTQGNTKLLVTPRDSLFNIINFLLHSLSDPFPTSAKNSILRTTTCQMCYMC